jgi:hypothetical protein
MNESIGINQRKKERRQTDIRLSSHLFQFFTRIYLFHRPRRRTANHHLRILCITRHEQLNCVLTSSFILIVYFRCFKKSTHMSEHEKLILGLVELLKKNSLLITHSDDTKNEVSYMILFNQPIYSRG